jgi:hypothetical protein
MSVGSGAARLLERDPRLAAEQAREILKAVPGHPNGSLVPGMARRASGDPAAQTLWLTDQIRVDRDYAIFGELSFDFTPKLTGTVGYRFFRYDNSLVDSSGSG